MLQIRLGGVLSDIAHRPFEFFLPSNEVIIVLPLPEGPVATKNPVSLLGAERLPGMDHRSQGLARKQANNDVNMIRHDAPRKQTVAAVVKVTQCTCYVFSDDWIPQVAGTCAAVKKLLDNRCREMLDFPPLVGTQSAAELISSGDDGVALGLDALQD